MKIRILLNRILIVLGVLLLIFSVGVEYSQRRSALQAEQVHEDANALYHKQSFLNVLSSAKAEEEPQIHEDFAELCAINQDVVGWLIAGENIDDPVVQRDNAYYLTHDFYGRSDSNGTLFVNESNTIFPRDDVLLIHGHNMRSGAMFGKLTRFRNYDYLCSHPIVMFRTIYDAQEVYYTPVFAFDASMEEGNRDYFDITPINFEDDPTTENSNEGNARKSTAYREYLNALAERSLWQAQVDVTENDKLLMLVTCSYEQEDGRFILVCRALREDETKESIEQMYKNGGN